MAGETIGGDDFSITNTLIAASTLLVMVLITDTLNYRFPGFGSIVSGDPVIVVSEGNLRTDRMHIERIAPDDIRDAMHRAGLEKLEQVKLVVLDPDGPWRSSPGTDPPTRRRPRPGTGCSPGLKQAFQRHKAMTEKHVEHYEMAGYGCARTYARQLGYADQADLLQTTLDEEGSTDKLLTELAETSINIEAERAD